MIRYHSMLLDSLLLFAAFRFAVVFLLRFYSLLFGLLAPFALL